MAPALDSGGTFLPKSYTRVALARAGRTSRTSNENNNKQTHTHTVKRETRGERLLRLVASKFSKVVARRIQIQISDRLGHKLLGWMMTVQCGSHLIRSLALSIISLSCTFKITSSRRILSKVKTSWKAS